jgi:uroporphyrinogen III methyltransferase/synthase
MVFLVGAGPGDPSLITCKALECIVVADLIVYDHLVNPRLLEYSSEEAEKIYVGKAAGEHTLPQDEINRLIADAAAEGKIVCRLKGGDPFIFGRGGEEAECLAERAIPFEVVPGVTSAIAAPAYAGIPLTHRKLASSVAFITGSEDPDKEFSAIAWEKISTGADTLVFLMGVANLPKIAAKLVEHGRDPRTPAAVIEQGTLPQQRCIEGKLGEIARLAEKEKVRPPAIIVVGDVVRLRDRLAWFENKPLFGKKILVTRAASQAASAVRIIDELGGDPIEFPTIRIEQLEDSSELDVAIAELHRCDWVVFTSTNGVEAFFSRILKLGKDARLLGGARICSIGSRTSEALERRSLIPDMQPNRFSTQGIIEEFQRLGGLAGKRVLLARSDLADETLPLALTSLGAEVEDVACYRTVRPAPDSSVIQMLLSGKIDAVTFTSASTARNFAAILGSDLKRIPPNILLASIGPMTTAAAKKSGLEVNLEAPQHTVAHLIGTIAERLRGHD